MENFKIALLGKTLYEIQQITENLGMPKFAAKQIAAWLYEKKVGSIDDMTNLSQKHRQALKESYEVGASAPVEAMRSVDGTVKYLFRTATGDYVEAVYIPDNDRATLCVSSQVGCKMNCKFCMTGRQGFHGHLSAADIISQFIATDESDRLTNAVFMGMGEPLDNYDNVLRFLELINSPDGMNIGMRHISLSTCGLVDRIVQLAHEKLQITLSVSLHAPSDEIRNTIMPVNRKYNVDRLIEACREYYRITGRRISFEYAMIRDVNDSAQTAELLCSKLRGLPAHVNLIPLNNVEESPLKPSQRKNVLEFQRILEQHGITATVRRTLGGDIDASCGQLRRKHETQKDGETSCKHGV